MASLAAHPGIEVVAHTSDRQAHRRRRRGSSTTAMSSTLGGAAREDPAQPRSHARRDQLLDRRRRRRGVHRRHAVRRRLRPRVRGHAGDDARVAAQARRAAAEHRASTSATSTPRRTSSSPPHVEPNNADDRSARWRRVTTPSTPSTIADERATNPFLLAKSVDEFAARREAKNTFK